MSSSWFAEPSILAPMSAVSLSRYLFSCKCHFNLTLIILKVFGLVRDPGAQNNWKIKNTEARLVAGEVQQQPKLTSSSLAIALS